MSTKRTARNRKIQEQFALGHEVFPDKNQCPDHGHNHKQVNQAPGISGFRPCRKAQPLIILPVKRLEILYDPVEVRVGIHR